MPASEHLMRELSAVLLTAADPSTKARVLPRLRKSIRREISEDYAGLLGIAPTVHFLPLQPKAGKNKELEAGAKKAIAWLEKQRGVYSALFYQLKGATKSKEAASTPPRYLLILLCEDRDVMVTLRRSKKGRELQSGLMKVCTGISATDEGEFGLNTMLLGL